MLRNSTFPGGPTAFFITVWSVLLVAGLAGCGGKATYPVKGKVVYKDGSPATDLAGHLVTFESSEAQVSATGVVQPDGTFELGTFEDGDGAPVGKYQVAISQQMPLSDEPMPPPVIDSKYGDFDRSGLEVSIAAKVNEVTLEVERGKERK